MAYTKVYAVHSRLDKKVNYALNEDQTRLSGMLDYALNPAKTQGEQRIFGSALNCTPLEWNLPAAVSEVDSRWSSAPTWTGTTSTIMWWSTPSPGQTASNITPARRATLRASGATASSR